MENNQPNNRMSQSVEDFLKDIFDPFFNEVGHKAEQPQETPVHTPTQSTHENGSCTGQEIVTFFNAVVDLGLHQQRDHHARGGILDICMILLLGENRGDFEHAIFMVKGITMVLAKRGIHPDSRG